MTSATATATLDAPPIKSGFQTSEFWQAAFLHAIAALSAILVLLHVKIDKLTAVQAAVPTVAMIVSVVAGWAYHDKRLSLKIAQLDSWLHVNVAALAPAAALLPVAESVLKVAAPALADQVNTVLAAWHGDMRDMPDAPVLDAPPEAAAVSVEATATPVVNDPAIPAAPEATATVDASVTVDAAPAAPVPDVPAPAVAAPVVSDAVVQAQQAVVAAQAALDAALSAAA